MEKNPLLSLRRDSTLDSRGAVDLVPMEQTGEVMGESITKSGQERPAESLIS